MPPGFEFIATLPWYAQLIFVACLGIVGGLMRIAFKTGTSAPAAQPFHLAGAVIDSKKADELIDAIEKDSLGRDKLTLAMEANTQATISSTAQIMEARSDIKDLTHELIRSGK